MNKVQLGAWTYLFSIMYIGFGCCALLIKSSNENEFILRIIGVSLIVMFTGILFKQNWARKIVVCFSYPLLLVIPLGTLAGLVFISTLKGKSF